MNIKNCPKCKKVFCPKQRQMICDECLRKEEEEFDLVRGYLRDNRGARIEEVSNETGVDIKKILKYFKEGKIEASPEMPSFLNCEKCGVSIRSGQFCKVCINQISNSLQEAVAKKEEVKITGKMYTIKRNNN